MKKIYALFLAVFVLNTLSAQRVFTEYETDSKWFIGLNAGAIWHTSDVKNKTQLGWGFMVGRSFNYNYGTPVSFDVRLRYLRGFWIGQDNELSMVSPNDASLSGSTYPQVNYYKPDTATIVRNFQTDQHRIALELAIHANRLRERTGLDLYLFGGIGLNWWQTYSNVLNNTDSTAYMYDYTSLNGDYSNTVINNLQDATYDTPLDGSTKTGYNVSWMPSVGLGIGYQVGPRFQVGVEHKTTFTRTDLWDGKNYDNSGNPSGSNDIYHYTGIYLKFNLRKGKKKLPEEENEQTTETPVDNLTPTTPGGNCLTPTVAITDPARTNYSVQNQSFLFRATVTHIEGAHQVAFKINGQYNTNFTYDPATDRFQSNVVLSPGQNILEVLATNACGSAEDNRILILETPQITPPIVSYQNPPQSPYETELTVFPLAAQVLNVDTKNQITLSLNGTTISTFTFNPTSKAVTAQLSLVEGNNSVVLTGTNQAGTDSKQTIIIRKRPRLRQPPVVNFINPASSPITIDQQRASILATVLYVEQKANISVLVNGRSLGQHQFEYNTANNMVSFTTDLIEGANIIQIKGSNEAGTAEKSTTIIYRKAVVEYPPIVTFLDPFENPKTVTISNYGVRARVQNVTSQQQISVWVNSIPTTNFTYSNSSQEVFLQTGLVNGANTVTVRGTNSAGIDEKSTTIIYRQYNPVKPPVVDITFPVGNPAETSTPTAQVQATVLNVNSQQEISVFVNATQLTSFFYDGNTHQVSFNAPLNIGSNLVKVVASTTSGYAEDVQTIVYKRIIQQQPPVVTFVNPASSPQTVTQQAYNMQATVLNVANKGQIRIRHNGVIITPDLYTFTSISKQVFFTTNLVPGNNIFEVTGTNEAGSDTETATVIYKREVTPCNKPVITMNQPQQNSTNENQSVRFAAQVTGVSSVNDITVLLNGLPQNNLNFAATTGQLTGTFTLTEGMNNIEILATNRCGSSRISTSVKYTPVQEPCFVPEASRVNPVNTTAQIQEGQISITASLLNITESGQISLNINGQESQAFIYDPARHLVTATVPLSEGNNTIRVIAENKCGAASVFWNIEYVRCTPPVWNLTSNIPAGNVTSSPTFNISGNVENISSPRQIVVNHNGTPVNFNLNTLTEVFSSTITLAEGNNTIQVTATNECGKDVETYQVIYKKPVTVLPPSVDITVPEENPHHTTTPSMTVVATVENVSNSSQITVTVNGAPRNFAYNASLNRVSFSQNWVEGANVIVVNATNTAGSSSDTKTVVYSEPVIIHPPVITFTNPVATPHIITGAQYTVTGYITNISSLNQVQCYVNNVDFAQYNPSLSGGQLNFTLPLTFDNTHPVYEVRFVASNEAGTDQSSRIIRQKREDNTGNCMPQTGAVFAANHVSVQVSSTKELSNVVLKFHDNTTQKFDNLSGNTGTFAGTGAQEGKCIIGVWIKSGCNSSNDGPGYGTWTPNTTFNGQCSTDKPCGPRFNPGNSAWQFCLITPSGTFTRDDLQSNPNFSYQGPASSAYFLPIAGGADATVNGAPYPIQSGRYYLFTGNLTVQVSSNHPGSMGHWQICIESTTAPRSGNGNNRPQSPCETAGNTNGNGNGNGNSNGSGESNSSSIENDCLPKVNATFRNAHQTVTVSSDKSISNVVLKFSDETTQKFDNLSGRIRTLSGTGENSGKCIKGVWIKSGCNSSTDGPEYGEWAPNSQFDGNCASDSQQEESPETDDTPTSTTPGVIRKPSGTTITRPQTTSPTTAPQRDSGGNSSGTRSSGSRSSTTIIKPRP